MTSSVNNKGYTAMMYYQGTPCPLILTEPKDVKQFEGWSEEMIKGGLKAKDSFKSQIAHYTEQMETLCKALEDSERRHGVGRFSAVLRKQDLHIWWLNCFALLRLKAIKSDDNFGLFEYNINNTTLVIDPHC